MAVVQHPWYFETDTPQDALGARPLLERYLSDHCRDTDFYPSALIYGELISNVVKHAPAGGVRAWLEREGPGFALCIKDAGRGFSERQARLQPNAAAESGRGLAIVKKLSKRFSFGRHNGGFVVRAVLPVNRCGPASRPA